MESRVKVRRSDLWNSSIIPKVPFLDPALTPFINLINPRTHPRARTRVPAGSGNLPLGRHYFPFSRGGAGDGRNVERDATEVGLEGTEDPALLGSPRTSLCPRRSGSEHLE